MLYCINNTNILYNASLKYIFVPYTLSLNLLQSVVQGHTELGVQNAAVSTVLDQATPVTMSLGPVMSAVIQVIGETHVYCPATMNAEGCRRLVLEQAEPVTFVHLDITGRFVLISAAITVLGQTMNVTNSVDPALPAVILDITKINV